MPKGRIAQVAIAALSLVFLAGGAGAQTSAAQLESQSGCKVGGKQLSREARVAELIKNRKKYEKKKCSVDTELQAYVSYLGDLSSGQVRGRIDVLSSTRFAAEATALYEAKVATENGVHCEELLSDMNAMQAGQISRSDLSFCSPAIQASKEKLLAEKIASDNTGRCEAVFAAMREWNSDRVDKTDVTSCGSQSDTRRRAIYLAQLFSEVRATGDPDRLEQVIPRFRGTEYCDSLVNLWVTYSSNLILGHLADADTLRAIWISLKTPRTAVELREPAERLSKEVFSRWTALKFTRCCSPPTLERIEELQQICAGQDCAPEARKMTVWFLIRARFMQMENPATGDEREAAESRQYWIAGEAALDAFAKKNLGLALVQTNPDEAARLKERISRATTKSASLSAGLADTLKQLQANKPLFFSNSAWVSQCDKAINEARLALRYNFDNDVARRAESDLLALRQEVSGRTGFAAKVVKKVVFEIGVPAALSYYGIDPADYQVVYEGLNASGVLR